MALLINMIGEFSFVRLSGPLGAIKNQVEIVPRRGVDGTAIWDTGKRGAPLRVFTEVDVDDREAGEEEFEKYTKLIGKDPVDLVWNDYLFSAQNVMFAVLDVTRPGQGANINIRTAQGGLSENMGAWIRAAWSLVPVTPENEEG